MLKKLVLVSIVGFVAQPLYGVSQKNHCGTPAHIKQINKLLESSKHEAKIAEKVSLISRAYLHAVTHYSDDKNKLMDKISQALEQHLECTHAKAWIKYVEKEHGDFFVIAFAQIAQGCLAKEAYLDALACVKADVVRAALENISVFEIVKSHRTR